MELNLGEDDDGWEEDVEVEVVKVLFGRRELVRAKAAKLEDGNVTAPAYHAAQAPPPYLSLPRPRKRVEMYRSFTFAVT